ncbi:UNVERIFIED_CONTAM: hypothetical protein PYX00_001131 [Menopon gallinae]|uniref:Uncharacterized protein n=1 Tax=Menopon gallinae TaxID=328185 RepID=A0AAW2ICE7_9NEOP
MACENWPPPLPSLPLYPPCIKKPKEPEKPPPVAPKNSTHEEWWRDFLAQALKRAAESDKKKKSCLYELTSKQRRELLPVRIPTKREKLIRKIPLPAGSYPPNGLPIWERLYLDCPLPMLGAPPDALVFARQQIGQKLWKTGEEQEFILYDPQGYEVQFSYENVHDPHLTNYYQGREIRGFLLSRGEASADGWSICTLKRFNQYRKYLRRVHLSLVHKELEYQDALQYELHMIKMYKQIMDETMEQTERKAMMEEAGAANREALRDYHMNRIKRLLKNIRDKERRVRKLYKRRAREQELRIKKGQRLQAEQELKKKISDELNRRKKIATLRRWHESDEKRMKFLRKIAEDKARQKAEKVRQRWHRKIDNQRMMFAAQDEHLELHANIRKENIELRNKYAEKIRQKQLEQFQELQKVQLRKKAVAKRRKEETRMSVAVMEAWLGILKTEYDFDTEEYRVKKSLNSTMAELLSQDTEGPNRYSIITMARNRIQREQTIPLQVSFAIEMILETSIELWASKRIRSFLETVAQTLIEHGYKSMEELKIRNKIVVREPSRNYKASEPKGIIYKSEEAYEAERRARRGSKATDSSRTTLAETEIGRDLVKESKREEEQQVSIAAPEFSKGVMVSYVQ